MEWNSRLYTGTHWKFYFTQDPGRKVSNKKRTLFMQVHISIATSNGNKLHLDITPPFNYKFKFVYLFKRRDKHLNFCNQFMRVFRYKIITGIIIILRNAELCSSSGIYIYVRLCFTCHRLLTIIIIAHYNMLESKAIISDVCAKPHL